MDNGTLKEVVTDSREHKPAVRPDDFYAVFLSNVYTASSCVALASACIQQLMYFTTRGYIVWKDESLIV